MRHWTVSAALMIFLFVEVRPLWGNPHELLREEAAKADLILFGTLANPRLEPKGMAGTLNLLDSLLRSVQKSKATAAGTTDLFIEQTLKPHAGLGDARRLEVPRFVPIDPKANQYLVFCNVVKGKIDPYRGDVATPAVVEYLRGMLAIEPGRPRQVLAHAFRHLEHPDPVIADDALLEFVNAEYEDLRDLGPRLLPDMLARWLQDEKLPHRCRAREMYAAMLGHCGGEADARLLRRLLDALPKDEATYDIAGLLVGYTLLNPKEGLQVIHATLRDADRSFQARYWAQKVVRFFWDARPEHLPRKGLYDAFCLTLQHPDMADIAVEDLRERELWDATAQVLALEKDKKTWDMPIMRQSVVRYALSCPRPEAAEFIRRMREGDAKMIQAQEEELRLRKEAQARPAAPKR